MVWLGFAFGVGLGAAALFTLAVWVSSAPEPPDARPPYARRGKDWW